jgi:hypothetical protein
LNSNIFIGYEWKIINIRVKKFDDIKNLDVAIIYCLHMITRKKENIYISLNNEDLDEFKSSLIHFFYQQTGKDFIFF